MRLFRFIRKLKVLNFHSFKAKDKNLTDSKLSFTLYKFKYSIIYCIMREVCFYS
ncbi:protein of unknown function [Tepidibacter aestuarii]|nr:protein of unknown function [Tepidibacter aestuarii]